jgi:hypothetical protein
MTFPDLDNLIAEVDRTCPSAEWIARLSTAAELAGRLQVLGDDLIEEFVEHCRFNGCSWADIGAALGVSRQAAQQRFLAPHRDYDASEFAGELSRAMQDMKTAAVHHRHNYIGTEHLLLGLLARENTATALLRAVGAPVDGLRQAVEDRLTLGASQAAERIAWTPYSRRAMALAKDLATQRNTSEMGCDHLLVGLARLGRGTASTILGEFGIDEQHLVRPVPNKAGRSKKSSPG